jgi:AraC-like DNA-binding protein
MQNISNLLSDCLVLPYVREAGFAVRNPWKTGQRRLLDYLLIYVQEGEFVITVEGIEVKCKKDDFVLIQPGILHSMEGKSKTITPFAHLDFFYNPNRVDSFPTIAGQIDLSQYAQLQQPVLNEMDNVYIPVKFRPTQSVVFRDNFLKMIDIWEQHGSIYLLQTQQLATELLLDLIKNYFQEDITPNTPIQILNWITSYILFNLSEPITVNDMASRANLSPSRFTAVFRQNYGISPHQFLIRTRIQHAEDLIRKGSHSLIEIVANCGFANVHHFSRLFKQKTGLSPSEFRNQCKE